MGGLDNLAFSVDIRNGLTEDQALKTIGHESFIHVEKTTKDVEQGIVDLNNGKFGKGVDLLGNFAKFMSGLSGDGDVEGELKNVDREYVMNVRSDRRSN